MVQQFVHLVLIMTMALAVVSHALEAVYHDHASEIVSDMQGMSRVAESWKDTYGNFSDPSAILYFGLTQLYSANLNDTFPTVPFLRVNPQNLNFYQLRPCERKDVGSCLLYGNATNGLPESLQGIWWQDGVYQPEQAISTAGIWDPEQHTLTIDPLHDPVWAFTSSTQQLDPTGTFWLPSGAGHYNYFITLQFMVKVFFNKDNTVGDITGSFWGLDPLLLKLASPYILNWTMALNPTGSWQRRSAMLGIDSNLGQYNLRQIIDGNGKPGEAFDEWLQFDGGKPFMYGVKVWP